MTLQTKRSHVREIALATALGDRNDVIRIPERFPPAKSPLGYCLRTCGAAQAFDVPELRNAIESTICANAAVAFQHAFAQVARITA
jgi:hypothetical protein